MRPSNIREMRRFIDVSEADAANVQSLGLHARRLIPAVVDRFYEHIMQFEGARAVLTGGKQQMDQLYRTLFVWLEQLFAGVYDDAYYETRRSIGTTHVRVGLPQHYMFTGMQVVWQELDQQLRHRNIEDIEGKLVSLHKLLMLDLAIMLESYKDSYTEQVREVERSAVEEKLTRAEHLAKIGQLAASLAHEIKNPLAGISGAIQIIRDGMPDDDPRQPIVTEILGQIGRLDATVKDLLQYARPTPPRTTKVALNQVAKRVLSILREEPALQPVRIDYDAPPTDVVVSADEAQIEQLLMNLLINAAHASEDGGRINLGIERNGSRVRLVVSDGGEGMSEEVRERAFEAFYTTKAKGTGLGLSICKRIAEAHRGAIDLSSELGIGTKVVVTLPSHDGDCAKAQEP